MHIHSVKKFGEAGIRLLLFLPAFALPLIAHAANPVKSGGFDAAPQPRCLAESPPVPAPLPAADLPGDEFDEALIPKGVPALPPLVEPPEPFRFECAAFRLTPHSGWRPPERISISPIAPMILRC